jgi:hypothetical protein
MKVESPAGELDVIITGTSVEGGCVVVNANVGLWEIKVQLGVRDFGYFLSLLFRKDVLMFLMRGLLWKKSD